MGKHKNKVITGTIIVALLAAAWFWGGNYANKGQDLPETLLLTEETETEQEQEMSDEQAAEEAVPSDASEEEEIPVAEKEPIQQEQTEDKVSPPPSDSQEDADADKEGTCTLTVRCDTILQNMAALNSEKAELVPHDGVIFKTATVTFYEGESVFNLLQREMKRAKIHMAFRNTPIYNSAYIEAINNLYEFDCGELSGWMYKVNGSFPSYGSSRYILKDGDIVEWVYTCDLGRDVGGYGARGGQAE